MNLDILKNGLNKAGLGELNNLQEEQFSKFYEMLIERNKVMNLTAITDSVEVQQKHFLDSLMIIKTGLFSDIKRILDLGTGAGFPGIPLKIMNPSLPFTLVDSLNKRVLFLNDVVSELGLKDIEVIHARAEDIARNSIYREKFDLCVSRAVAGLSTLCEYCIPFVKNTGHFIAYKSGNTEDEVNTAENAIKRLGGQIDRIEYFKLPDTEIERSFIIIEKVKHTPEIYPRKAGTPQKNPIR